MLTDRKYHDRLNDQVVQLQIVINIVHNYQNVCILFYNKWMLAKIWRLLTKEIYYQEPLLTQEF